MSAAIFAVDHPVEAWKRSADVDDLVEHARKGEQKAFLGLFQAYARQVYTLSLQVTRDVTAAENLTQDIFVEVFSNLDAVCDDEAFATLLSRHVATTIARRSSDKRSVRPPRHRQASSTSQA